MKPYPRNTYQSRGKLPGRDILAEETVSIRKCLICGDTLFRKTRKSGKIEGWGRFLKRQTCGKYTDSSGKLHNSQCFIENIKLEKNPNYKGILPKCHSCGIRLNSYPSKNTKGEHCKKCEVARRKSLVTNPPQSYNK